MTYTAAPCARLRGRAATVATVVMVLHTLTPPVADASLHLDDPFAGDESAQAVGLDPAAAAVAPTISYMPPLHAAVSPPFNNGGGNAGLYMGGSPPFNTTWYVKLPLPP
jgi:hypothetical protein